MLGETEPSEFAVPGKGFEIFPLRGVISLRGLRPLIPLLALALTGCGDKPPAAGRRAAPPVTVAQPVKRTVTDWDEFTGRFEAIEEVQVRARVGGFVNQCRVQGRRHRPAPAICSTSSIPARSRRSREQADGQLADARAKVELAKRELDRGLTLVQTSAVSEQVVDQRRQALQAAHAAETAGRRRAEGGAAQCRIQPCDGADRRPRQPPSGHASAISCRAAKAARRC